MRHNSAPDRRCSAALEATEAHRLDSVRAARRPAPTGHRPRGRSVRWDELFADLEAQAEALRAAERDTEVAELTRLETSRLSLASRLGPAAGTAVRIRCLGGTMLSGRLSGCGPGWLLLDEGAGREALLAAAAVTSVAGLGRWSGSPGTAVALGLGSVLRAVARDRSVLRVGLTDATVLDGTL